MNKKARLLAGVLALSLAFSIPAFATEANKDADKTASGTDTSAAATDKEKEGEKEAEKEEAKPEKTAVELKAETEADEKANAVVENMKKTFEKATSVQIIEKVETDIKNKSTRTEKTSERDISLFLGEMLMFSSKTKETENGVVGKEKKTIASTEETGFAVYNFDGSKWSFGESTREDFTNKEKEDLVERFGFYFNNLKEFKETGTDTISGLNVTVHTANLTGEVATAIVKEYVGKTIDGIFAPKFNLEKEEQKEAYDELMTIGYAAIDDKTPVKVSVYIYAHGKTSYPLKMKLELGDAAEAVVNAIVSENTAGSADKKVDAAKEININKFNVEITTKNYSRLMRNDIPKEAFEAEKAYKEAAKVTSKDDDDAKVETKTEDAKVEDKTKDKTEDTKTEDTKKEDTGEAATK